MKEINQEKFKRAQEKVRAIRGFHRHFAAFIIVFLVMIVIKTRIFNMLSNSPESIDLNFNSWLNWNFAINFLIWAIVLCIHGLYVYKFKPKFLKEWEEKKLRQIIANEDNVNTEYNSKEK